MKLKSRGGDLAGMVAAWARRRTTRRVLLWSVMPVVLWACASLPPQVAHEPVAAFARPSDTGLGALAASAAEPHAGRSGFMVLDTGHEAFLQRARLIEAAERSVDAQYYIWNSDRSGHYLACRLYAAAERGVRVRLILDDMNILGRDAVIAALDRHPNVAVRIFNPNPNRGGFGKWLAFGAEFQRLNRRMHNKSFTVDAAFGIVGGRNIGDEYFDLHPAANFRDRDVLVQALVDETREEILVESAYFILGDEQLERLTRLRTEGIRVAALTNSLASNDLTTNHSGYARRRKAMLAAGLELFELRPDAEACVVWIQGRDDCGPAAVSLHSKSAVFDRRVVYIGSFNINLRSMYLNSETVLLIHSRELAGQVAEAIELAMAPANSWRVTKGSRGGIAWSGRDGERWTHEPVTGYWHRVRASLFRLVPMEKYL